MEGTAKEKGGIVKIRPPGVLILKNRGVGGGQMGFWFLPKTCYCRFNLSLKQGRAELSSKALLHKAIFSTTYGAMLLQEKSWMKLCL